MDDKDQRPGSVSNQNREQAQPGHRGDDERDDAPDKSGGDRRPSGGESGEGSQSTGDPKSAG
jgi:hypothetical protein